MSNNFNYDINEMLNRLTPQIQDEAPDTFWDDSDGLCEPIYYGETVWLEAVSEDGRTWTVILSVKGTQEYNGQNLFPCLGELKKALREWKLWVQRHPEWKLDCFPYDEDGMQQHRVNLFTKMGFQQAGSRMVYVSA
jgi:hypothetical protein